MKELLEVLAKLWAPISGAPLWVRIVAIAVIAAVVMEVAQCAFLGSSFFWIAARFTPWPQMFEPNRVIVTTYEIRAPGATDGADADGCPCPIGSRVIATYTRSSDGWVSAAGWNEKEGFYSIAADGIAARPIDKEVKYEIPFEMTSSAGREYFIVLARSKPFDPKRYLDMIAEHLKLAAASGKGGVPQLGGVDLGRVEVGRLGSCLSGSSTH
ncbi:hypothetical protein HFO38_30495 [Rhizobium leguminosarum]|uniref:hypothetical protein n=1 Tax=Rhizobium leguminosarum TaxID=384 RepID=UPI001C97A77A|nr:hypothetical protein [Rhizobium leguminosarum]MBY5706980.1 hypothetical protein [Rhizobium leguminosarum]